MQENKTVETHIVPPLSIPIRLQEYGVGVFSSVPTKSALKKVLKKKFITVNGAMASTGTYINGGETITLIVPTEITANKKLIFELRVIYEDEHLALIHKPGGILVSGNGFKTIAHALPQNLQPSTLPNTTKPQPVHRLDYATTGVLLTGKTGSAIRKLNQLFEDKKVQKVYYAVTIGEMPPYGKITSPIDDKNAESHFEVVQSVASEKYGTLNLAKLDPKTGRRHQLRKHLASISNPILGDQTYGREGFILKGKGLYLHAYSLEFIHPFTAEKISITDDLPKRFTKIFGML
ncbi:RluA family pseudouridine synthase [Zobellia amurskyensis]|uniref:RluA family pseudouridine synthase n=1 Tax=Zobellia amurskyensis TaxID=248905 RepID=A0A7X2ZT50_9FLAO|nr:RluA family pseudouridine synthase [Zobellia amurskyensis]MUH35910.1 RluA family pseudouridine synthase [Zobellia amurskyensis]